VSLFALPIVGRAGLGNMLFPWARAEIFAKRFNARVLRPSWNTVRPGPYFSIPLGPQRIEFNGHRIFPMEFLLKFVTRQYRLEQFS